MTATATSRLPDTSDLRLFLHGLPGVDKVGVEARAAALGTRSVKTTAKAQAIDLAISMVDPIVVPFDTWMLAMPALVTVTMANCRLGSASGAGTLSAATGATVASVGSDTVQVTVPVSVVEPPLKWAALM